MAILTLAEAKQHLRIAGNDEDAEVQGYLNAAHSLIENHTERVYSAAAPFMYRIPRFPRGRYPLEIRYWDTQSVTQIEYLDIDGMAQTLTATHYDFFADIEGYRKPIVQPKESYGEWPPTQGEHVAPIEITASVGGATPSENVKQAARLLVGAYYMERDDAPSIRNILRRLLVQERRF